MASGPRLLFVDDEPSMRELMPSLLKQHGFDVTVASTVAEAINFIAKQPFDVLLSDLNIGEPGDGFTVVSAMRRTQPGTATFILTGYPAFESALDAIRNQVDDYFVKPADVSAVVSRMLARLNEPSPQRTGIQARRLSRILEEHKDDILSRWLESVKADERIRSEQLSNQELSGHMAILIEEIITASSELRLTPETLVAARRHGSLRAEQGCGVVEIIREAHILHGVLCRIVEEKLLSADISFLITDVMRIGEAVEGFLEEALRAFMEVERPPAATRGTE